MLKLLSLDGGAANVASNGMFWPAYTELYRKLKLAGFYPEFTRDSGTHETTLVDKGKQSMDVRKSAGRNVSFAEAFLRGGVGAYIGTYRPVGDAGVAKFSKQPTSKCKWTS